LRTTLFSRHLTGPADPARERVTRPPDPDRPGLEQQQALLVAVLRRAGGRPVSFSELKDAGIEFPASVMSELELAGVAIERCFASEPGARKQVGVRLLPDANPGPRALGARSVGAPPLAAASPSQPPTNEPRRTEWDPVRVYRTGMTRMLLEGAVAAALRLLTAGRNVARRAAAGRRTGDRRLLAPILLLAAAGVGAAVVVSALGGAGPRAHAARARYRAAVTTHRHAIASPRRRRAVVAKTAVRSTPASVTTTSSAATTSTTTTSTATTSTATTSTAAQPPPVPVSPASATDLEAQGHQLMVAGQYQQAVPVLQRALHATGEQSGACLEPTTQACLTYAFALYDLGRSLRLAGDPAAAVPILKRRLEIDNQRPVVAAELAQARQQTRRPAR
jgi:hypothetical protein